MVALWNRAYHYILSCGFFPSIFYFPRLISAAAQWNLVYHRAYFDRTKCRLSANLERRSEMCCNGSLEIQDAK